MRVRIFYLPTVPVFRLYFLRAKGKRTNWLDRHDSRILWKYNMHTIFIRRGRILSLSTFLEFLVTDILNRVASDKLTLTTYCLWPYLAGGRKHLIKTDRFRAIFKLKHTDPVIYWKKNPSIILYRYLHR